MSKQNYQELKIKLSTRKMMAYGYNAIKQMPKSEKHVLGADIRKSMHSVMSGVIACEKSYYKNTTFRELDIALENLRVLVLSTVAHARHSGGLPAVSKLLSKHTFRSVK